jgi:cell wall-associated NlpC family hydrolase
MTSPVPDPVAQVAAQNAPQPAEGVNTPIETWGQVAEEGTLVNINPVKPPAQRTLVYSPDVQILIAHNNVQYDVSGDIVAWSVRRVENGVSSLVFRLSNKVYNGKLRYDKKFERMDRVTVKLKRTEWVQVFSGYLDSVPHVQLYPGTVNFRASCTLKRLVHTWWDPGLPQAQGIFNQAGALDAEQAQGELSLDTGLGSLLRRLLVEVGGWNPLQIHISRFPVGFYYWMENQLRTLTPETDAAIQNFKELLLGTADTSMGVGKSAGRQAGVTMGGYAISAPDRLLEVIRAVDEMGMGPNTTDIAAAQGISTAATGGTDIRDQEAWKAQAELGKNWGEAAAKNDAAVHCYMCIMAESAFVMYANAAVPASMTYPHEGVSTDGTSVGLYQQQDFSEWGTVSQRMNVKASTQMFLQHLKDYDWRNMPRAAAIQQVQRSRFGDGSNYAVFETAAVEAVRAARAGTGTANGTSGQSDLTSMLDPALGLGGTTIGAIPPIPVIAGALSGGVPTSNGTPTTTGAASMVGMPLFDSGGALSCALAQVGKPYIWGARGPASFDCSGLMQFSYRSIGLEIGSTTYEQAERLQRIPASNLRPGDIIQPNPGHTVMYAGPGVIVQAPQPGDVVRAGPIYFDITTATCLRVPGVEFGGIVPTTFDIQKALSSSNAVAGTVTNGTGGTSQTGSSEPVARNLFTYQFSPGMFSGEISINLRGEKSFINDEPVFQTVVSMAQAGMRNFQSAPNGDFVAYYPDYFGIDGKDAVWNLEDVEMKNVQIDLNDDALATHVYVSGSTLPTGGGGGIMGWLGSMGVATVEKSWLFQTMQSKAPHVPDEPIYATGAQVMRKFGVRPLVQSMSGVMRGPMEFLLSVQLFMRKWAEQYSTQIETTFMPEVFPGMRVNLVGHNLQVYVTEVVHSGDFESGFTTTMTIMAPSLPGASGVASTMFNATAADIAARQDLFRSASETT